MKVKIFLSFLILFFLALHSPTISYADYWTQKSNYPGNGRSRAFCFSINDMGYFGCGDYIGYASDFWQYDTTSNTWTQKASFGGGGRWSGVSFSVGGFGFAGLGWSSSMMDDIWKYDPVANTWTQMNNFPAGQRQVPISFVIGNKAFLANGRNNGNIFQNDLWEYDYLTDSWTQKANVPGPTRSQPFAFSIDGYGYVGGGFDQSLNGLNDFHEYDPVLDTWTTKASIPAAGRGDPAGFAIGCMGYTGTGQTLPVNNVLNDFWEFNPATNQWIAKATFGGTARDEASFFTIGTKGYIGLGGVNGGSLTNDFWEYTPDTTCITILPVASFTAPNHICPGTCTDFTNQSANGSAFQWTFAGANPGTSTDVNPAMICYMSPGNYTVTLIATNASGSDTLILNNYITVYPYPAPQGIIQNGDTLIANAGSASYQWYLNGSLIPGATDYFHVATEGGNYNLIATDANGCEAEAVIFDVVATIGSVLTDRSLTVYPNPASHYLLISPGSGISNPDISVYNILGEKIITAGLQTSYFKPEMKFDIQSLSPGLYWIEIYSADGKKFRLKFVKQ